MASTSAMTVAKCPSEELAKMNSLVINSNEFPSAKYAIVTFSGARYAFNLLPDPKFPPKQIGLTAQHRRWASLALNQTVTVSPAKIQNILGKLAIEVDVFVKGKLVDERFKAEEMASHFANHFNAHVFSLGELLAFEYHSVTLSGKITEVQLIDISTLKGGGGGGGGGAAPTNDPNVGILNSMTQIVFIKAPDSTLKLEGSIKVMQSAPIISPNFKFEDMGIGGLDAEFQQIFRRAFQSRIFPPQLVQEMGIKHVKGLLLYGPPGTGKTLLARQIGKLLNAREPKIVNGPEVLNKYVGQTEENIRNLFKDAELEYKSKGDDSGLHIIIFDELDAICKQRGSRNDGTGVGDSIVNQLLSKIDGVEQLNNILVIGMTNRKDLIDEALLRSGRLELHVEISLPDKNGRLQILKIHTAEARKHNRLADDVDLPDLAERTKNFSGAEIQGLVNSAASFAMNRHVMADNVAKVKSDVSTLKITHEDFLKGLSEVIPAFGYSEEDFKGFAPNGIISYNNDVEKLLADGRLYIQQAQKSEVTPLVSLLFYGAPGSGKTALATTLGLESNFPFLKVIHPEKYVAYSDSQKASLISKVFEDAHKSPLSCIVVDGIERLLEYVPFGQRFSNIVLQTLLVLMSKNPPPGHRLLILATTNNRSVLESMGMTEIFSGEIRVPTIQDFSSVFTVTQKLDLFNSEEQKQAASLLKASGIENNFSISIKRLLNVIEKARQDQNKVHKFVEGIQQTSAI